MLKAGQKRIDALGRFLLANLVGDQLMDIAAQHPQILDFARAANFVAQALSIGAFDILKAQFGIQFDFRHAHLFWLDLSLRFASQKRNRKTERFRVALAVAGALWTRGLDHSKDHE